MKITITPVYTKHLYNIYTMSYKCFVFAGTSMVVSNIFYLAFNQKNEGDVNIKLATLTIFLDSNCTVFENRSRRSKIKKVEI